MLYYSLYLYFAYLNYEGLTHVSRKVDIFFCISRKHLIIISHYLLTDVFDMLLMFV